MGCMMNRIEEDMRWLLRANERQDCSGQVLAAEGFEFLRDGVFFSVTRSNWI